MADRWDVNYETFDIWGPTRSVVTPENAGKLVRFRVEEQKFIVCQGATPFCSYLILNSCHWRIWH